MSYIALYRKFRPSEFNQVKGQEHIVTTLKNQIKHDRLGHAYLFCGTRGTGKTSVAKLFAKAVNCLNPTEGEPCNECVSCRNIISGAALNVIEIDAASNNGVDNIRQINEEVQYSPTQGKYKVYIIDEVHMLSTGAFNALLKTLEEPPSYVIFILATTEVHKIPITIMSRCQRYDFRRISVETIKSRLKEMLEAEGNLAEDDALEYIAKIADGSMRDAISLLDKCLAFYIEEKLTYDKVLDVLGAVDTQVFSDFLRDILKGDVSECIKRLDEVILTGRELTQFITDFIWYLRNLLLLKTSANASHDLLEMSTEKVNILKDEAKNLETEMLIRYIRIFSDLSGQIKFATSKRVLIEIALIKIMTPSMENNLDSLYNRLALLEKKMEEGIKVQTVYEEVRTEKKTEDIPKPVLPRAVSDEIVKIAGEWGKIEQHLKGSLKTSIKTAKLSAKGENTLLIVFSDQIQHDIVGREDNINLLKDIIAKEIGKQVEIEVEYLEKEKNFNDYFVEIAKKINMPIIEEQEEF